VDFFRGKSEAIKNRIMEMISKDKHFEAMGQRPGFQYDIIVNF
jgi:hypothetical protein